MGIKRIDNRGRYTPEVIDEINSYIQRNMTQKEICDKMGMSTSTFYILKKKGKLADSLHFRGGATKVDLDHVKLSELQDDQRLDGTPKLEDLPYKDHPDYDLPFDDIEDDEPEEINVEPEVVKEPKRERKSLIQTERLVTISGPYHKVEIENNSVKIKMSLINDGISVEKAHWIIEDMITELSEMKLALSAGAY